MSSSGIVGVSSSLPSARPVAATQSKPSSDTVVLGSDPRLRAGPMPMRHVRATAARHSSVFPPLPGPETPPDKLLDVVQERACQYFWDNASPTTGLVLDRASNVKDPTLDYTVASMAATGFGLSSLVVAAKHGWLPDAAVQQRIQTTLETALKMPSEHGFLYHFVDPKTGQRAWNSEVSPIDTTLFLTGALTAAQAYPGTKIADLAKQLYDRVDWPWMLDGGTTLRMGWTPEKGFIPYRWDHYDESSAMYVLAIGSPTHPIPASSWRAIQRTPVQYDGYSFIQSPPLFTHQYSQLYLDLRHKSDGQFDYFNSSTHATLANKAFSADQHYPQGDWGVTASDGPDGYKAYGADPGFAPHDGTIAPTAALGSYEFTPKESLQALQHFTGDLGSKLWGRYGLADAYNQQRNWYDTDVLGIDQGAEILSIENGRTGLVWNLFNADPSVQRGMQLIGFKPD